MVAIKTIGEVLKDKRTELGLGLSEAERLTNIPKLYIIALETGDYKALPGDFYIKAYLKQYAEKLDLDADQIMLAYEKDGSMSVEDHEDIQETYRFVKPSERVEEEEEEESNKPAWRHYVPIILLSAVALAIVGSVTAVVLLTRPPKPDLSDTSYTYKTSETKKSTEEKKKTTESSEKPVESKPEPQNQITVTGSGSQLDVKVENATNPTQIVFTTAVGAVTTVSLTNTDWATVRTLSDVENTATATLGSGLTSSVINLSNTQGLTMTINGNNVDMSALTVGTPVQLQLTVTYASTTAPVTQ